MPRNLTFYPTVAFPLRAAGFGAPAPRHGQTWGVGRTSTRNFRKAWLWLRFACKLRIGHCFEIHCITVCPPPHSFRATGVTQLTSIIILVVKRSTSRRIIRTVMLIWSWDLNQTYLAVLHSGIHLSRVNIHWCVR